MRYITIEREYGSGATKIAGELAKQCHIPCYGEEILEGVSKRIHMTPDQMRECEEKATNSFLYSLFVLSQSQGGNDDMLSKEAKIFIEEQRVIRELAKKGSAVFIGHCAAEALKEEKEVWKVYIYADKETKHKRIREDYGIADNEVDRVERKMNKRRSSYYFANTQKKWDDFRNYDIVLNSTELGTEGCVNVLKGLMRKEGE